MADHYASTYLKITGSSWALTTAPVLGGGRPTPPVGTSVAVTWPAAITYGTAATVSGHREPGVR